MSLKGIQAVWWRQLLLQKTEMSKTTESHRNVNISERNWKFHPFNTQLLKNDQVVFEDSVKYSRHSSRFESQTEVGNLQFFKSTLSPFRAVIGLLKTNDTWHINSHLAFWKPPHIILTAFIIHTLFCEYPSFLMSDVICNPFTPVQSVRFLIFVALGKMLHNYCLLFVFSFTIVN
jgi:hypothetical protein